MANKEHLRILKRGVKVWNEWRNKHSRVIPDLKEAHLFDSTLVGVNLRNANLNNTYFTRSDLREADLSGANLRDANLLGVNLHAAILVYTDISYAELNYADLSGADLRSAILQRTLLYGANLHRATVGNSIFADVYLSKVKELETVMHRGPSQISVGTIYLSKGEIPEIFLRNCGLPESFIIQIPALLAAVEPLQFYSCFISYSSMDQEFAERLHTDLQAHGVRVWFAPHDLLIGARIRSTIDESIRIYDKLLLVLSKASVASQWVEQEVETALAKERQIGTGTVLFPIRLDDSILAVKDGWPALIKNTRNVGDFTLWKAHDSYQRSFKILLRYLKAQA